MLGQLVAFCLLWNFVLFLAPGPAYGNFQSGDCTVEDSPVGTLVTSVIPTCSNDSAAVEVVARSYDDIRNGDRGHASLLVRIDYICIGNDGQQIRGTPWTTNRSDRRIDVTNLDTFFDVKDYSNPQFIATVQQSLQQGTNCTFYLCYKQRRSDGDYFGRISPISCVTDIDECDTANGGCEHSCNNTIGSFNCSCDTGYQLDGNGLNCSDINECEVGTHTCNSNANCTDTEGSFDCTCREGFEGDGFNCTDIDECNTGNGGCERNCTNTIGSFNCRCDTGYQLEEDGLNCSDINECEVGTHTCNSNANCTDTDGSFNCTCRDGFEGDGFNCTDIDECNITNGGCEHNCTNTIGSFNCSCDTGYQLDEDGLNCSDHRNQKHQPMMFLVAIAPTAVLITVLCVAICVVYNIRKQDRTMLEVQKLFYKDEIDLSYNPISPFSKLMTFPSVISVFDKLGTIPDTGAQTGNTDTESKLEFIATPINELMDTSVHKHSTSTAIEFPASGNAFVASNSDSGYGDPNAPQSTDAVSLNKAESSISPPSYSIEESEEDQNSINSEINTQNDNNSELGVCNDMPGRAFVEQSNGYIHSEHGPLCTFDENSHIVELDSEFLPTMFPEEAAVLQPIPAMMEPEESYVQSSFGCLSDTHVLASVEENPDSLGLQNPDSPSIYIGAEDELSLTSLEQMQHLSTSSGYIKDCSKPGDVLNYGANELTLSCS